jgi:integrase
MYSSIVMLVTSSGGGFPIKYDHLHESWDKARAFLGEQDNPMATIKALRRTAARHLTTSGMPTEMVGDYLRHSDIKTTMGYLHLVGGYSITEQRRWLS